MPADDETRRCLLTAVVSTYQNDHSLDRPGLHRDRDRVAEFFSTFGYEHSVNLVDPTRAEFTDAVRDFCLAGERHPDDYIVLYVGGHGEVLDAGSNPGDFVLLMHEVHAQDHLRGSLRVSELAALLLAGTPVRRLLVLVDACFSGEGVTSFARTAGGYQSGQISDSDYGVTVVSSALATQYAVQGVFTHAMRRALRVLTEARGGTAGITFPAVIEQLTKQLPRNQQPLLTINGNGVPHFLGEPDSTFEIGLTAADQRRRRRTDLAGRFRVHFDGFVGRLAARAEIVRWLADPAGGRSLVVTGNPGSGKTALLGWVAAVSADDDAVPAGRDERTHPAPGAVDVAIYAGNLTPRHVLAGIATEAGVPDVDLAGPLAPAVAAVRTALAGASRPLVVLIDALEEAVQPEVLVTDVLLPLVRDDANNIRLLLGARREIADRPGAEPLGRVRIDLDAAGFADFAGLRETVRRRLAGRGVTAALPPEVLEDVSAEIAEVAGHSFFLARLLADHQAARETAPDPADPEWLAGLPRDAGRAMYDDLEGRVSADPDRVLGLLLPLAYAQGDGLPWAGVWPVLAEALTPGGGYSDADPDRLRDEVASYVAGVAGVADVAGRRVHRLCHQALAGYLRSDRDAVADQRRIVAALLERVPRKDGRADWPQAHPYTRTHLVGHAMESGDVDRLAGDPGFLLTNEPSRLLPALDETVDPAARAAADAYRLALPWLRTHPAGDHPAYLGLAARCVGAAELADRIGTRVPWRARWASWLPYRPHLRIDPDGVPVNAVVYGLVSRRPTVVSGGDDGLVRVWDAQTGGPLRAPLAGHDDAVTALAVAGVPDRHLVVSGSADRTVRVWDLTTGEPAGQPFTGNTARVVAVAVGSMGGIPVVFSGGDDHAVHLSDLAAGTPAGTPFTRHTDTITALASGRVGDRSLVVSADRSGIVLVWEPHTDELVTPPLHHTRMVRSVVLGEVGGRPVVITGCDDTKVHVWDLETGAPARGPFAGHTEGVHAVAAGRLAGRSVVVSGGRDGRIRIFDTTTGKPVGDGFAAHTGEVRALAVTELAGRPAVISGGADRSVRIWDVGATSEISAPFSGTRPDARCLGVARLDGRSVVVAGGTDARVRVWDLATGRPCGKVYTGHDTAVTALATGTAGGRPVVASGSRDGIVRVWDLGTHRPAGPPFPAGPGPVTALALTELDGRLVVVAACPDKRVRAWGAADHAPIGRAFESHDATVRALAVTRLKGDTVVVSGGDDGKVRVWAIDPPGVRGLPFGGHRGSVTALTVTDQGDRSLVVSGDDRGAVRVWELATRTEHEPAIPHGREVLALGAAVVGGRRVVISGSGDGTARTWDLATHRPAGAAAVRHAERVRVVAVDDPSATAVTASDDGVIKVWDIETGVEKFGRHAHWVRAVAVGEVDGRRVVVSGSVDTTVRLWDLADGRPIGRPLAGHTHGVRAVAITETADGDPIVVSGGDDRTVRIWDPRTGTQIGKAAAEHPDWVRTLATVRGTPGGLVLAGGGTAVRPWRLPGGEAAGVPYSGHDDWVRAVAVGRLGGRTVVVSASADRTVHVWDLETGRRIGRPFTGHHHPVRDVAIAELAGRPVVVSAGDDGTVRAWDLETREPVGEPLGTGRSPAGALVAVSPTRRRSAPGTETVRVVTASGEQAGVRELSTSGWQTTTTLDLRSDVLGLAVAGHDRLVLGGKLGIVVLDLPG